MHTRNRWLLPLAYAVLSVWPTWVEWKDYQSLMQCEESWGPQSDCFMRRVPLGEQAYLALHAGPLIAAGFAVQHVLAAHSSIATKATTFVCINFISNVFFWWLVGYIHGRHLPDSARSLVWVERAIRFVAGLQSVLGAVLLITVIILFTFARDLPRNHYWLPGYVAIQVFTFKVLGGIWSKRIRVFAD